MGLDDAGSVAPRSVYPMPGARGRLVATHAIVQPRATAGGQGSMSATTAPNRGHHDRPENVFRSRRRPQPANAVAQQQVGTRRARFCLLSALIIVPLYLAGVSVLVGATHLRYLLYPSLAAIGYDLFIRDPHSWATTFRNAVVGPVMGAGVGVLTMVLLPVGPLQVLAVTVVAMGAMRLLKVVLAPALAVALLTLLTGSQSLAYLFSVAASSLALMLIFRLWRDLLYVPRFGPREPEPPRLT